MSLRHQRLRYRLTWSMNPIHRTCTVVCCRSYRYEDGANNEDDDDWTATRAGVSESTMHFVRGECLCMAMVSAVMRADKDFVAA